MLRIFKTWNYTLQRISEQFERKLRLVDIKSTVKAKKTLNKSTHRDAANTFFYLCAPNMVMVNRPKHQPYVCMLCLYVPLSQRRGQYHHEDLSSPGTADGGLTPTVVCVKG